MTTLSATISHKAIQVPVMNIPEKSHEAIMYTIDKFKYATLNGPCYTPKVLNNLSRVLKGKQNLPEHLEKFIAELERIDFSINENVAGTQQIHNTLLVLNDMIRMCFDLTVRKEISEGLCDSILLSLNELSSFPQICCAFSTSEMIGIHLIVKYLAGLSAISKKAHPLPPPPAPCLYSEYSKLTHFICRRSRLSNSHRYTRSRRN